MTKLFFAFLLVGFSSLFGQHQPFSQVYFYRSQCIEDVKQLQNNLTNYHPAPYDYISKENLNQKFSQYIHNLPDSLNSYQFYNELTELTNQVRDGHLFLSANATMNDFEINQGHLLPFTFLIFDYKLFVQANYGKSSLAKWDIITSINGVATTDLIYELLPLLPTDGYCSSRKIKLLEENFALLYARKYGFSTTYTITSIAKNKHGKQTEQTIQGIKVTSFMEKQQAKKKTFYFEIDQVKNRAYLKTPSFSTVEIDKTGIRWNRWLKKHFKQVKKQGINHLILDLRNNQGGSVKLMAQLMKYLMHKEFQLYETISINPQLVNSVELLSKKQQRKLKRKTTQKGDTLIWNEKFAQHYYFPKKKKFKGILYVLMDGGTYSSASHAVQLLTHRPNTAFYGEETGGNGVKSNAGKTLTIPLKNSGFNLHLPLMKGVYKTKKTFPTTSGILPAIYCGNDLLTELKYNDICLLNILEGIQRSIQAK